MEAKSSGIITPEPFFKIKFECGNRAFYQVKGELYDIAEKIGIEIQDGYITEECDYEGDLEKIIIYNCDRAGLLINCVLNFYGVPITEVPEDMDVVLSIF